MKHVGIERARQKLADLIELAEAGEKIIITRHGKPMAELAAAPKALQPLAEFHRGLGRGRTPPAQLTREERNAR